MTPRCLLCLLLLTPFLALSAETFDAHVTAIVDGDTLLVEAPARGQLRVRLAWIDAPDRLQAHGEASRASLNALATGQNVRLENAVASNRQWVATVWVASADAPCRSMACPKTLDLGLAQLARGMVWHDRRSLGQPAQELGQYEQAEFQAKIRRFGLWAGKNPLPPWDWRGR